MENEKCMAFVILKTMLITIVLIIVTIASIYCIWMCKLLYQNFKKTSNKKDRKLMSSFKKLPFLASASKSTNSDFSWNTTWDTSSSSSQTKSFVNPLQNHAVLEQPKTKLILSSSGSSENSNFSWNTTWDSDTSSDTAFNPKKIDDKIYKVLN